MAAKEGEGMGDLPWQASLWLFVVRCSLFVVRCSPCLEPVTSVGLDATRLGVLGAANRKPLSGTSAPLTSHLDWGSMGFESGARTSTAHGKKLQIWQGAGLQEVMVRGLWERGYGSYVTYGAKRPDLSMFSMTSLVPLGCRVL